MTQPKCYAWMPGDPDVICAEREGHEGDHRERENSWPRATSEHVQEMLEAVRKARQELSRAESDIHMAMIHDGRHDLRDEFGRAEEEGWRSNRLVCMVTGKWRDQIKAKEQS